jgi:large subunit ribosomal protein L17
VAENRKLGRTADHRLALLKNQVTSLFLHGQIKTTEPKAKEVKSLVDSLMALAIKEKDNFEMVEKNITKAKLDAKGHKVTEKTTSKNGKEYYKVVRETIAEKVQKDSASRLAARRKIMRNINKIKDENGNNIDLPSKLLNELATKYADKKGGYSRIIRLGKRKGDAAEEVILQLV